MERQILWRAGGPGEGGGVRVGTRSRSRSRSRSRARSRSRSTVSGGGRMGESAGPGRGRRTGEAGSGRGLRWGTAEEAGLLGRELEGMVEDVRGFLGPSPVHPWCAGAVLLAGRGGTVALHRAVGWAARWAAYDEESDTAVGLPPELRVPMTPDTVFDVASLTKLFTALLAVRQIERGTLELGERVAAYLPGFGGAGKAGITVRQLLGHTSGLRAELPLYEAPDREGRLRLLWEEVPLDPPGTAYRYSDLNMIALHLLLERITGHTLERLLHDEITAPLGMHRTRFVPPLSWRAGIAATEDARQPWARLDRGMVRGEVHDENAYAMGGVAGHAGVFSDARDLAVLARTLLDGGAYGSARVLSPASVDLLLTDINQDFPGHAHGLGFELDQRWYMGALSGPRTAGHTGFTGTSLVLDPESDAFLILLANSVHPVRTWRTGSAPRVAAAHRLARAIPVRPPAGTGPTAWFSGMSAPGGAALSLPATGPGAARLTCLLWWDTAPGTDRLVLEAATGTAPDWRPVAFRTAPLDRPARTRPHPDGTATGWSGRRWHHLTADLPTTPPPHPLLRLRFRYATASPAVGRGVYVTGVRVLDGAGGALFDESLAADASRVEATGWHRSAD
ncbi:serine hydrolase domain-containing protein [Streptomyces sp. NPDC058486]|uniref:serine hydrolase domain-containing protein n=1 Tax=unclassified Streptomyces TaxID=2593676 RepID=UPI00364DF6C3